VVYFSTIFLCEHWGDVLLFERQGRLEMGQSLICQAKYVGIWIVGCREKRCHHYPEQGTGQIAHRKNVAWVPGTSCDHRNNLIELAGGLVEKRGARCQPVEAQWRCASERKMALRYISSKSGKSIRRAPGKRLRGSLVWSRLTCASQIPERLIQVKNFVTIFVTIGEG
jgi:hypothetical protein